MDVEVFKDAQAAYSAGDYRRALEGFAECMRDADELSSADMSKFYHLVGNCYMKSDEPRSAAAAYARALTGSPEERKPSLYVNLGTALLAADKDAEALSAFNYALSYTTYATPYKALSGIGAVQLKRGEVAEAAQAYRSSALDEANPVPGRALVNLGVCFMELGRPADAISTYEAARECGLDDATLAQANANLGQAYMAEGRVARAIEAFEAASSGGAGLSSIAQHDYELALVLNERIGSKVPGIFDTGFVPSLSVVSASEPVSEPSSSGATEMSPSASGHLPMFGEPGFDPFAPQTQSLEPASDDSAALEAALADAGISETDDDSDLGDTAPAEPAAAGEVDTRPDADAADGADATEVVPAASADDAAGATDTHMPSPEDTDFFDRTESEIKEESKRASRSRRRARGVGLTVAIVFVVLIVCVLGAAIGAYALGYGYPLQEDVASGFLTAVSIDGDTDAYWAEDVDAASRDSQETTVSGIQTFEIEAVTRTTTQTSVFVTGTLDEGGTMRYELTMSRNGISWAIEYVELYFPSQNQ